MFQKPYLRLIDPGKIEQTEDASFDVTDILDKQFDPTDKSRAFVKSIVDMCMADKDVSDHFKIRNADGTLNHVSVSEIYSAIKSWIKSYLPEGKNIADIIIPEVKIDDFIIKNTVHIEKYDYSIWKIDNKTVLLSAYDLSYLFCEWVKAVRRGVVDENIIKRKLTMLACVCF